MARRRSTVADAFRTARDGLENLVSGLGLASKDKTVSARYVNRVLTDDQLMAAYRSDWIARKIVSIPAEDATREWREWQADDEQIKLIETEERRLQLQQRLLDCLTKARLFGGALMIMGINDEDPTKPLNLETVRQGSLKFVHVATRIEVTAGQIDTDPMSDTFGEPSGYQVNSQARGLLTIHPTRCVRLIGNPLPRMEIGTGWGDSVLQAVDDAIKQAGTACASLAALLQEAKTDVVKIPDLMSQLATKEFEDQLIERFELTSLAQSIVNTKILDGAEEWDRISTNFQGIPDAVKLYLLVAAGAADIPATRMLGQSAVGLSATGEGDIRNYYDMVASQQNNTMRPALARLDEVLIRSAIKDRPEDIWYEWAPLWQMDDKEKAEVAYKKAQTFEIHQRSGAIDPQALSEGLVNQLTEDGVYPGLELKVAEQSDVPDVDESNEDVAQAFDENLRGRMTARAASRPSRRGIDYSALARTLGVSDAAPAANFPRLMRAAMRDMDPRPLYIYRPVVNGDDIREWAKGQGLTAALPAADLHVTICYSRTPVDWLKAGEPWIMGPPGEADEGLLTIPPGGPRVVEAWPTRDGRRAIVLQFASSSLSYRHEDIRHRTGAGYDFDQYIPHVTITYDAGEQDVSGIVPYTGKIILGPEVFEEVREDWVKSTSETKLDAAPLPVPVEVNVTVEPPARTKTKRRSRITRDATTGEPIIETEEEDQPPAQDGGECGTTRDPASGQFTGSLPCETVYHGTGSDVVDQIMREGLVPGKGEGADAYVASASGGAETVKLLEMANERYPGRRHSVYVTESSEAALRFASFNVNDEVFPVIFKVSLPADDPKLKVDEAGHGLDAWRYEGTIRPENIDGFFMPGKVRPKFVSREDWDRVTNGPNELPSHPGLDAKTFVRYFIIVPESTLGRDECPDDCECERCKKSLDGNP